MPAAISTENSRIASGLSVILLGLAETTAGSSVTACVPSDLDAEIITGVPLWDAIQAASGGTAVIVPAGATFSLGFWAQATSGATPGCIRVGQWADPGRGQGAAELDNWWNRRVLPHVGSMVTLAQVPEVAFKSPKIYATEDLRRIRHPELLDEARDESVPVALASLTDASFEILPLSAGAVCRQAEFDLASDPLECLSDGLTTLDQLTCLMLRVPELGAELDAARDAYARQVGSYVRRHHVAEPAVREAISRQDDGLFPWAAFNTPRVNSLVISTSFPPVASTAGIVAAKRLAGTECIADVISQSREYQRIPDPESSEIARRNVGRHHWIDGPARDDWESMAPFCHRAWRVAATRMREVGRYESIYSRAMMPVSLLAGALMKLRIPETTWIAEFGDPIRFYATGVRRHRPVPDDELSRELLRGLDSHGFPHPKDGNLFDWIEHLVFAFADTIVYPNANLRDYQWSRTASPELVSRAAEHTIVRAHPTPDAGLYDLVPCGQTHDASRISIGYFGVFYGIRSVDDLLAPFASIGQDARDKLRLYVYTNKPAETQETIDASGFADCVEARPYLPYLQYLNLLTQFDWLVVPDSRAAAKHRGVNPYLPSKLSDYRGSGARIWAMVEDGSPLSRENVDARSRLESPESAVEALRHIAAFGPRGTSTRIAAR